MIEEKVRQARETMVHTGIRLLTSLCIAAGLVTAAGCASVSSTAVGVGEPVADGVVYYMPNRPIKVSITVPAAKDGVLPPPVPSVDTIAASADLSQRFLLNFETSWVGRNHANIGVNTNGLLTTSNADVISGVPTIVQNIARALGSATALAAMGMVAPLPLSCPPGRTYVLLLFPERYPQLGANDRKPCGFSVELKQLNGADLDASPPPPPNTERVKRLGKQQSGVFYKPELPYRVVVTDPSGLHKSEFVAFSPNLAPISYIPVTRGFFANNQTNITLSEGIVTAVDSVTTGELVALTQLPADFISAYAAAITQVFTGFAGNASSQTTLIANEQALAAAKIQRTACTAVIDANRAAFDPGNLVGADGEALSRATAAITAALANIQSTCR